MLKVQCAGINGLAEFQKFSIQYYTIVRHLLHVKGPCDIER